MNLPNGFYILLDGDCLIVGDLDTWKGISFNVYVTIDRTKDHEDDKKRLINLFYAKYPEYINNG